MTERKSINHKRSIIRNLQARYGLLASSAKCFYESTIELQAQLSALEKKNEEYRDYNGNEYDRFLFQRGIEKEDACKGCGGIGIKCYGDTTTWRGGIGGQAITNDVCDKCWGSGRKSAPWPSHREHRAHAAQLSAKDAIIAELQKENEWLPIESAPKDKTAFMAYNKESGIHAIAHYGVNSLGDGYFYHNGSLVYPGPTHWHKLPEPPKGI